MKACGERYNIAAHRDAICCTASFAIDGGLDLTVMGADPLTSGMQHDTGDAG